MSVFAPDSECRILSSAFGSTEIGVGSLPAPPYNTPGTRPARRVRRASFFPRVSRAVASSIASIFSSYVVRAGGAGPRPRMCSLDEQRRNRRFLVNALDCLAEQAGHREHHDLLTVA